MLLSLKFLVIKSNGLLLCELETYFPYLRTSLVLTFFILYLNQFLSGALTIIFSLIENLSKYTRLNMYARVALFVLVFRIVLANKEYHIFPLLPTVIEQTENDICSSNSFDYVNGLKNLSLWAYDSKF